MTEVIHQSPGKVSPGGKHVMPCCGRQPTDMPPGVLLTMHPERVTCTGPEPWRVFGPGEHCEDRPSEDKAYERVRALLADGEAVTVYQWEHGRWVLFEHLEPTED